MEETQVFFKSSESGNYTIPLFKSDLGEKITLNGIDIILPSQPIRSHIMNYGLNKGEQKWNRIKLPEDFDWEKPEDEYTPEEIKFVEEDFNRRLNGLWLYINGVATYITGVHYYYLQWCKLDIGYPDYRDRDRRFFTFWEACVVDPYCLGMIMVKHRREGATYKAAAIVLEYITRTKKVNGGLLSKTGADAKEFFYKVVQMFRDLPKFYQPMIAGTDNPKTVIEFNKPGERITKSIQKVQKSEALSSKIEWKNTAENSFDSYKLARFVCDEGGKWEEADVSKNWKVVRPTLSDRVLGKAFFPSTVNEMTQKGGEKFKLIWDGSDPNNRTANNRTIEGLYRYFTPAYDGLEYENEVFIDEFGNSVIEDPKKPVMGIHGQLITMGAKTFLANIRKSLEHNTRALAEHKRQFPWDVEEAFRVEATGSSFDVERLYNQREWNDLYAGKILTRGNFVWRSGFGSDVTFIPSKTGRWLVAWIPNVENQNKKIFRDGRIYPGNIDMTVSGADPYDHSVTTDSRRSNGASYVFNLYNPAIDHSNAFVAEYINRPDTVFLFYEDILKQVIFYGCQVLAENNRVGLINWFIEHGYGSYLMNRPEVTHTSTSRTQRTPGVPTSGDAIRESLVSVLEAYVVTNCGVNFETGKQGNLYFNTLIDDLLKFDANAWTKYDASVAAGLTLLATKKLIKKPKPIDPELILVRRFKVKNI